MIMYTNQQILVDHTETCVHVYLYNVSVATTVNELNIELMWLSQFVVDK